MLIFNQNLFNIWFFFHFFNVSFEKGGEREWERERKSQAGFATVSMEPDAELKLTNYEIMT